MPPKSPKGDFLESANVEILHNSRTQFFPLGGSPEDDGGINH